MKSRITFVFGTIFFLSLVAIFLMKQPSSQSPNGLALEDIKIGKPVSFENVTIFPIISKTYRGKDRFITLDQGLKEGLVEVVEAKEVEGGSNNRVNEVYVTNRSDHSLYLMPGEIIVGGDQDRMIASETIIKPSKDPTAVQVFCVEQGRWGSQQTSAQVYQVVAENQNFSNQSTTQQNRNNTSEPNPPENPTSDASAKKGKFHSSVGIVTRSVWLAGQVNNNQSKVWDKVSQKNRENFSQSATQTFKNNYVKSDSQNRLQPMIDHFQKKIAETENVVGVVVAVNGVPHSMDAFESTPLFKKLWPKLLKSYALEAVSINRPSEKEGPCSVADANKFVRELMLAKSEKVTKGSGTNVSTRKTENVYCVSACVEDEFSGEGFAGLSIHASGYAAKHFEK